MRANWDSPAAPACHITSCQLTERLACQPVARTKLQVIYFSRYNQTRTQPCTGRSRYLPILGKTNKYLPFLYVESGDDVATDLTPVKNEILDEESRTQMSSEPPTEGTNADEGFGAGSESDPFTDKMVSGDREPLVTCLLSFVVINLSEHFKNVRFLL